jgi:hypothetical protein
MKYKPTPFNVISVILILLSIWTAIRPDPEGWGFFFAIILILPIAALGLLIDFFLQKSLADKYKQIFLIEITIILLSVFFLSMTGRTKTFIIPNKLDSNHIVMIYGIDDTPKLPINFFTWDCEIKIPENGILLTSSSYDIDLPQTKMRTYSNIELNSDKTELGFGRAFDDEVNCKGKTYKYRSWLVQNNCCMSTSKDIDSLRKEIETYLLQK